MERNKNIALGFLIANKTIGPEDAATLGIGRLAPVIAALRRDGYQIRTEFETIARGVKVTRYVLLSAVPVAS